MVIPETRLPWLVFGDGSQGQLLEKKDAGPDEEGVNMIELRFRPTEELMEKYGIPRSDLDHEWSLRCRVQKNYFWTLSDDPVNATVLILCDVKCRKTKLTDMNAELLETITGYEKRIKALEAQVAWLHADNKKKSSNIHEYIKQNSELFLEAIKVRGEIDTDSSKD